MQCSCCSPELRICSCTSEGCGSTERNEASSLKRSGASTLCRVSDDLYTRCPAKAFLEPLFRGNARLGRPSAGGRRTVGDAPPARHHRSPGLPVRWLAVHHWWSTEGNSRMPGSAQAAEIQHTTTCEQRPWFAQVWSERRPCASAQRQCLGLSRHRPCGPCCQECYASSVKHVELPAGHPSAPESMFHQAAPNHSIKRTCLRQAAYVKR